MYQLLSFMFKELPEHEKEVYQEMARQDKANKRYQPARNDRMDCTGEYISVSSIFEKVGGAVASWLARSTPERAFRVRALAGDIVLCSWARHFTLTVLLSTQVYKWVPANLTLGGNPAMD